MSGYGSDIFDPNSDVYKLNSALSEGETMLRRIYSLIDTEVKKIDNVITSNLSEQNYKTSVKKDVVYKLGEASDSLKSISKKMKTLESNLKNEHVTSSNKKISLDNYR